MTELPNGLAIRLKSIDDCESSCFSDIVTAGSLDPAIDFIGADLSGLSMAGSDLSGYNFSSTDLRRTNLRNAARVAGMIISENTNFDPHDKEWLQKQIGLGEVRSQSLPARTHAKKRQFGFEIDINSPIAKRYIDDMLETIPLIVSIDENEAFDFRRTKELAAKYVKLALYYHFGKSYGHAAMFLHRAEDIYQNAARKTKYTLKSELGSVYHLLALCYMKDRNFEEAKLYSEMSLRSPPGGMIAGSIGKIREDTYQDILTLEKRVGAST